MNCKMGTYKTQNVYLQKPLLIINPASKHWGSGDPWKKVTAKFVGLHGWMFDEILHYLCGMNRLYVLWSTG